MADVFISYSRENAKEAEHIREVLESNNISCWIDHEDILGGEHFLEVIEKGIDSCRIMLIVLSEDAQNSIWVPKELVIALERRLKIIPYRIEDCQLQGTFKSGLADINYIDAFPDGEKGITAVLESINEALNRTDTELVLPVRKKKNKEKKLKYTAIGCTAAVLALLAVIVALKPWSKPAESVQVENDAPSASFENTAKVYYSEVLPYTKAGFYDTLDSVSTVLEQELSVDRAFSILSFVRNYGDHNAMVEKISCEIMDLKPIEEPVLIANGYFKENTLNLYLLNNGWGGADDVVITCEASPNTGVPAFEGIETPMSQTIKTKIGAGEVAAVGKYVLDATEVDAWEQDNNRKDIYNLKFRINTDNHEFYLYCFLAYDVSTHSFSLEEGGKGDSGNDYSITLYGILDVDKRPDSIVFTGAEASPVVSDTFRIETVIAPTKSCEVACKGVYSVNGDPQETDTYRVSVFVPVFQPAFDHVGLKSELMSEIAAADTEDPSELAKICSRYRYQPESIIKNQ